MFVCFLSVCFWCYVYPTIYTSTIFSSELLEKGCRAPYLQWDKEMPLSSYCKIFKFCPCLRIVDVKIVNAICLNTSCWWKTAFCTGLNLIFGWRCLLKNNTKCIVFAVVCRFYTIMSIDLFCHFIHLLVIRFYKVLNPASSTHLFLFYLVKGNFIDMYDRWELSFGYPCIAHHTMT